MVRPETDSAGTTAATSAAGATAAPGNAVVGIGGIRVVDDYTLEVAMAYPFAEFPMVVGVLNTAPVPKEELDTEAKAKAFALMPVGNGPFMMAEPWKSGQYVKVVRFEDYTGTKPSIDGVRFKIYTEAQTAWTDFQAGTLDWVAIPPGQYKASVAKYGLSDDGYTANPGRQVQNGVEPSLYYLDINNQDLLLKNVHVRAAISLAINRQAICDAVWEGTREPASSGVPAGIPGYKQDQWKYCKYDVEQAKAELSAAGYPGGVGVPTVKLTYNSGALHEQIMQLVQAASTLSSIPATRRLSGRNFKMGSISLAGTAGEWTTRASTTTSLLCSPMARR
jgi:oligopeptide transport system substrate-binding protein